MQSPEVQSLLNNPRALQAMMQIQSGLSQLQLEAPSLAQASRFLWIFFSSSSLKQSDSDPEGSENEIGLRQI